MKARFGLAAIAANDGELKKAEAYLEAAVKARPEHPLPYAQLAIIAQRLDQDDRAIALLRKSISLYKDYEPERGVAHASLGHLLEERGQLAAAAHQYREALRCRAWDFESRRGLAQVLARQGQFKAALEQYQQLIEQVEPTASDFYNMGVALQQTGQIPQAARAYQQALQKDPSHVNARTNFAATLAQLGYFKQALAQVQQVLRHEPNNALAHRTAGLLCAQLGQPQQAIMHLRRAIELSPEPARPALQRLMQKVQQQANSKSAQPTP